jgi:cellulose synthase/poly-beta-1,6-N-acetylglucosamine synthase-like glycosyltransferase
VDIEWSRAAGPVLYPGGDSLVRVDAIRDIGGWGVDLIAGEDPDIGFRLHDRGWQVVRLAVPMVVHDARIERYSQYWRRAVRSGFAYAAAGWRNRRGVGRSYFLRGLRFVADAASITFFACAALLMWPMSILAAAICLWIVWRSSRAAMRSGLRLRDAAIYGVLTVPARFAQTYGFASAMAGIATGGQRELIEYRARVGGGGAL